MIRGFLTFSLMLVASAPAAWCAPFVPEDDGQVIETLPFKPIDPAVRESRELRARLSRSPADLKLATELSRRYIEQGRAESDPRFLGYAQAVLAPWWDQAHPPLQVLLLRATLRQNAHEFDDALQDLGAALKLDRRNPQALLTRATVLQVRGEYEAAMRDCLALRDRAAELIFAACAAGVAATNGRLAQSYEWLRSMLQAQPQGRPGIQLWVLTELGEMAARLGDPRSAENHFKSAVALNRSDGYLLGAYADFLLDQKRPSEVVAMLKDKTRADPLLLRLALAQRALASREASDSTEQLRSRFEASRIRGDTLHMREEARYALHLLNDPVRALKLAQAEWRVQKEPADARILLEAAIAARDLAAAREATASVASTAMEDVELARLTAWVRERSGE